MVSGIDVEGQLGALLGDVRREIDISRRTRVFCNRNLRMSSIEVIGLDMDYTLALYHQDKLEQLSIDLTIDKMIANHGYPEELRSLHYDPQLAIRGLVVDKELGNVFKMDRHGHVGRVFHGKRLLERETRKELYRNTRIELSQSRFKWIDTLFGLPEAVMFMTLVDFFDARNQSSESPPDYVKIFQDIRASIDEAHRDGTLKSVIRADLAKYVIKDPKLAETLHKLRSSGKRLFVLTNSYYPYTEAVMSYLLDGERKAYPSWRNYFDVVMVGGNKPAFFTKRNPFLALDPETGDAVEGPVTTLGRDRIYQGGNITDLEDMMGVKGEKLLYVGDHIYGDLIRLKKSNIWRTMMVVQELDREASTGERLDQQIKDLALLDRRRRNLASEIDYQVEMLKRLHKLVDATATEPVERLEEAKQRAKKTLSSLRDRYRLMDEEVDALEEGIERAYNPHWGAVFREGNENSRFGEQVSDYADIYTSRVSNFLYYSPLRYFRAPRRQMPHELS